MDYTNQYGEVIAIPVADEVWLDDEFFAKEMAKLPPMRRARDSPIECRPKDRWIMTIYRCRKSSAANSVCSMAGAWWKKRQKRACPAQRFQQRSGTSSNSIRRWPNKKGSIFYWYTFLTGWAASKAKRRLCWSGS